MDRLFVTDGLRRGGSADVTGPAWVLVIDGRVLHAGPQPPDGVPEGVPQLRGGWLVEPLADAHVHLFLPGSFESAERSRVTQLARDQAVQRILTVLAFWRSLGVAAVRDGGDPDGHALEAARIANARPDRYAAVLPAGEPVYRKGRYGSFLGRGVDDVASAVRLMERNRAEGATHAKILATGINSLDVPGKVGPPQFDRGELQTMIRAARTLGLQTMVHANGPLLEVLAARPDSVEHGFWLEDRDLASLADLGIAWTPTLGAWAELDRHPDLTDHQKKVVAITHRRHRDEVARGNSMGVSFLAGSDAGTPGVEHGQGLWNEIRRLAEAGLSAREALTSAFRSRAVCEQELGRDLGGLKPGSPAGFVWVTEDPAEDPASLSDPRGVWLGGEWSPRGGKESELRFLGSRDS